MTPSQRTLLVAAVVAALIGFAAGWFARVWTEPTVQSSTTDTERALREKVRGLSH